MDEEPFISVIVPVYNGRDLIGKCLDALNSSSYESFEIIVVNDASTDDSADISRAKGATVLALATQSGPAAARNFGAQHAKGSILFFVDADVVVQPGSMARVASDFLENFDVAAVFGSYDDTPAEKNFISQYKNLQHHFVHQQSSSEAVTFWAGCGAIRREAFVDAGGFDQLRYTRPCIEDIELGYRMKRKGYKILLDKQLQAKHLKRWRLGSLLRADIFCRAIPWSKLILESKGMVNDLNLQTSDRLSAGLVGLSLGVLPLTLFEPRLLLAVLLFVVFILILNHKLYRFFLNRRGLGFAVLALPLHFFYFFYSGVCFAVCWGMHNWFGKRSNSVVTQVPR